MTLIMALIMMIMILNDDDFDHDDHDDDHADMIFVKTFTRPEFLGQNYSNVEK